jgi:hypothetical protein
VTQADEAIQVLYTKMYPVPWAGKWALPSELETRSPIQRAPVAKGFLDARFKGRRDDGPLPGMAAGTLDGMRVRLRENHYSYRTEQTYLDWVRRFLIFAGGESEDDLGMEDVKAYLEFLAVDRRVAAAMRRAAMGWPSLGLALGIDADTGLPLAVVEGGGGFGFGVGGLGRLEVGGEGLAGPPEFGLDF